MKSVLEQCSVNRAESLAQALIVAQLGIRPHSLLPILRRHISPSIEREKKQTWNEETEKVTKYDCAECEYASVNKCQV